MENQSEPRIQNEIQEKKEWIKPELDIINVTTGDSPNIYETFFGYPAGPFS